MRWDVGGEDDDLPPLYSASTVTKHNGHPRNPGFPRITSSSKHSLEVFGFGFKGVRTWTYTPALSRETFEFVQKKKRMAWFWF